jgi:hypothetical protein
VTTGLNCTFTVNSYGTFQVRVTAVSYGLTIKSSESEARNTRAFYPLSNTEETFTLEMVFRDTEERDAFNSWVRNYWDKVSANENIGGFVTVSIPVRNFVRQAIPSTMLEYGAHWDEVTVVAAMQFVGTINPIDGVGVGDTLPKVGSYYVGPTTDLQNGLFFYPSGIQVGNGQLAGTLYNGTGTPAGPVVARIQGLSADGGAPVTNNPYVPPPITTGDTNKGQR